jgi:hypothetical protein
MGLVVEADLGRVPVGDGDRERGEVPKDGGSLGLGKKKESGFHLSLDRSGGFLTLRYVLKERRARLA